MFGRECREFYWNRRRRTSARQEDCIIEESSEHESEDEKTGGKDEEEEGGRYRAESAKRKSVSRSSSGRWAPAGGFNRPIMAFTRDEL